MARQVRPRTPAQFLLLSSLTLVVSGNLSAQAVDAPAPLGSLKTVSVPEPSNLGQFVRDREVAIVLGKALFWEMQVGSDGMLACASCHFKAGADNRTKNQISPGLNRVKSDRTADPDGTFTAGAPNYTLTPGDYPFHRLADINDRNSAILFDSNDVTSSQGMLNARFLDVVPGSSVDKLAFSPDPVFNVNGVTVRRVEPRNTPTMINAVFNFRNFWDGRAQNIFNGVNPFGLRDPNAFVFRATTQSQLDRVKVALENSSLASQAVGPPLSAFEMSGDGRQFPDIGQKLAFYIRLLGKKLYLVTPLAKQQVHPQDSVLGNRSRYPLPGLNANYASLVQAAFRPEWWDSNVTVKVNRDGSLTLLNRPPALLATDEFTLLEYNFSLFFGLSVQMYESTLVANDTPLDRFLEGNTSALNAQQQRGMEIFQNKGRCINCHGGPELTKASVAHVRNERLEHMVMGDGQLAVYDNGFYNVGVRPTFEDLGVGGSDPSGNPLSESRVAQLGKFNQLLNDQPNIPVASGDRIAADGAFKTPGLRNVELTAPYFHNGGQMTLRQVVDFYNRGGDRRGPSENDTTGFGPNPSNLDPDIQNVGLTDAEKNDLVEFLKGLTDDRVRLRSAPFDHPQLFITNGHPLDHHAVTPGNPIAPLDGIDSMYEIPATGRNGGAPLPNFLASP